MDIRKVNSGAVIQKYEDKDKAKDTHVKKAEAADVRETKDKISISGNAKNANIANIAVGIIKNDSQKEFSVEKLNGIMEKVKSGTYDVPSNKIAKAMLCGIYTD